jgi:hypothetical protein
MFSERINRIRNILLAEGVKVRKGFLDDLDTVPESLIPEAKLWLRYLDNLADEVRAIKDLQPQEQWDRYKLWKDFDSHREVVLLKEATMKLKRAVHSKNRAGLFKKVIREQASKLEKQSRSADQSSDGATEST